MQKGFATILILVGVLIMAAVGGGAYYLWTLKNNPQNAPVVSQTPKPTAASSTDETANWKTYVSNEGKFTLKYPKDWHFLTAKENYGTNYKGARVEILFSNKLDKNGKIPSGVSIDRSTAQGILAINGCNYASGCDIWTTETKFYDTKSPQWQGGGGPYPSTREITLSELGSKKAILIKEQANTNTEAYKGEYSIQYNVLLENKEHRVLTFTYNDQNEDNDQI